MSQKKEQLQDLTKCKLHKLKELKKQKTALWNQNFQCWTLNEGNNVLYKVYTHLPIHFHGLFFSDGYKWPFERLSQLGLGGGNSIILMFIPKIGEMIQFDSFSDGVFNHQLVGYQKRSRLESLGMFFFAFKWHFRIRCVCPGKSWVGGDEFPAVPQLSNEKETGLSRV